MESGFTGIDDRSLEVSKSEKLFLIRIPKEFNVPLLNDFEIDLGKDAMGSVKGTNGFQYNIKRDKTGFFQERVRPVLLDRLSSSGGVSRPFDDVITITQDISATPIDISEYNLPFTYPVIPQLDYVRVRQMPRGSTSTLSDLKKRQAEAAALVAGGGDKKSKKHKKDKQNKEEEVVHVAVVAAPVAVKVEEDSEEKKKKKKKKDKSNKD